MLSKGAFIKSPFNKLFDLEPYHDKKQGCSNEAIILLGVQL